MTKTMAEVLAAHSLLSHERSGTYACSDPDCGWEFRYRLRMDDIKSGVDVVLSEFTAHQAAALSAAGFGLVQEARDRVEALAAELSRDAENAQHYADHGYGEAKGVREALYGSKIADRIRTAMSGEDVSMRWAAEERAEKRWAQLEAQSMEAEA